ncbi:MAG TPA: YtxH domain-containing protein [Saprospiraceae bacterium]|nr:YtxH domain-containing protein [Saprospiraceae bacterium]
MNTGKALLGLLAGVAVGATLGVLLAPDKGSSTRKKIYNIGEGYVDEIEGKFNEFVETMTKKYEAIRKEAIQMADNGKGRVEDAFKESTSVIK